MLILHIGIAFIDMTLPDRENRRRAAHCVSAFRRHVSSRKWRKVSGLPSASFPLFRSAASLPRHRLYMNIRSTEYK